MFNLSVAEVVSLDGKALDVGGKGNPSYRRFLPAGISDKIIVIDLEKDSTVDARGSLLQLPVGSGLFDHVLCFNVLEHVFDYRSALKEIRRVLRRDGIFYGYVPFLVRVHEDPHDHWRYTEQTLEKILSDAGFDSIQVFVQGGALLVVFDLLRPFLGLRLLRFLVAAVILPVDRVGRRFLGDSYVNSYPLGFFFLARSH